MFPKSNLPRKDTIRSLAPISVPFFPTDAHWKACVSSISMKSTGTRNPSWVCVGRVSVVFQGQHLHCWGHGQVLLRQPQVPWGAEGTGTTVPSQCVRAQGTADRLCTHRCRPAFPWTWKKLVNRDLSSYTGAPNLKFWWD